MSSQSVLPRFTAGCHARGRTFQDIARKPDSLAPLITMIVLSVALTETMLAKIGMERIVRQALEQNGQAAKMSPDQLQQTIEQGARFGGIIAHVVGALWVPIFIVVVAAVGLLFTNAFFGAQVKFKTSLAVMSY